MIPLDSTKFIGGVVVLTAVSITTLIQKQQRQHHQFQQPSYSSYILLPRVPLWRKQLCLVACIALAGISAGADVYNNLIAKASSLHAGTIGEVLFLVSLVTTLVSQTFALYRTNTTTTHSNLSS
jgi:hypothetical protein